MSSTTYQYVDGVKSTSTVNFVTHTVTAADVSGGLVTLTVPSDAVVGVVANIYRASVDVKDAAPFVISGNTVSVADGGTYSLTAGDSIQAVIYGTVE